MSRDAAHPGPTCWVTRPLLRIDYALLSPGLAADDGPLPSSQPPSDAAAAGAAAGEGGKGAAWVRGYQRMDDGASDHFAVVVDLALRSPAAAVAEEAVPHNN